MGTPTDNKSWKDLFWCSLETEENALDKVGGREIGTEAFWCPHSWIIIREPDDEGMKKSNISPEKLKWFEKELLRH